MPAGHRGRRPSKNRLVSSKTQPAAVLAPAVPAPQPALQHPPCEAAAMRTPLIYTHPDGEGESGHQCSGQHPRERKATVHALMLALKPSLEKFGKFYFLPSAAPRWPTP